MLPSELLLVILSFTLRANGRLMLDKALIKTKETTSYPFRSDYDYLSGQDEFVKLNLKRKTWQEAKLYCEAEGANLAVIRTKDEAKRFRELIWKHPKEIAGVWIGLHDLLAEGEFVTIKGEPITRVYNAWAAYEPNDGGGDEDCVTILRDGKLNDARCSHRFPFFCQKERASVTFNRECQTYDLGYKMTANGDECYKVHVTPRNWEEAYITCQAEQAKLAIVNSAEEATRYVGIIDELPKRGGSFNKNLVLLGFHDKFRQGDFVTIDGKPLSQTGYEQWAKGQPDVRNDEHCGAIDNNGKLHDINCFERAIFICEMQLRPLDRRQNLTTKKPNTHKQPKLTRSEDVPVFKERRNLEPSNMHGLPPEQTEKDEDIPTIKRNIADGDISEQPPTLENTTKSCKKDAVQDKYENLMSERDIMAIFFPTRRVIERRGYTEKKICRYSDS